MEYIIPVLVAYYRESNIVPAIAGYEDRRFILKINKTLEDRFREPFRIRDPAKVLRASEDCLPMAVIPAGGLSTVIALPESEDPHRNAHQLFEPACAAAE